MSPYSTLVISRERALAIYARKLTDASAMSDAELGDALDPLFEPGLYNVMVSYDEVGPDDEHPTVEGMLL